MLILFGAAFLQLTKLVYLQPLTSLFTIIGGVIAIILFDVQAPIPDWGKIVFTFGVIAAVAYVLIYFKGRKTYAASSKEQPINSESLVLKTSERETEDSNLDPALYHLSAVLFYPKDTLRKDRVPSKSLPRRGIINWSTKKVYYMNKDADDLLIKRRINWITREWIGEEDFAGFLRSKDLN